MYERDTDIFVSPYHTYSLDAECVSVEVSASEVTRVEINVKRNTRVDG